MEPISTALAGIALVKQSVEFIKTHIETVKDIGEISGAIDGLLNGEQQVQKDRFSSGSVMSQHKSAANSVIDAKLAAEQMAEIRNLVNLRFGSSTWQEILNERARRLQEEKEAEAERRRLAKIKAEEVQQAMLIGVIAVSIVGLIIASIFGIVSIQ